jgi:hypothetical protein
MASDDDAIFVDPTWLNLVFKSFADFGDRFAEVGA